MAQIRAQLKRSFLRSLWRQAQRDGVTLPQALDTWQEQLFPQVKKGRQISSAAAAGASTQFSAPRFEFLNADSAMELSEELIVVYEDCLAAATTAAADTGDAAIFTRMMLDDRLQTISQQYDDFTLLRTPSFGPSR